MFDDLECLRDNPQLLELFSHYANLGEASPETWQGRLMKMAGVDASGLSMLHGELLAFDWIEQNTGQTPCCYRITQAGLRALRHMQSPEDHEEAPVTELLDQAA
jgi:hypothetical protein